jgi:protease-4
MNQDPWGPSNRTMQSERAAVSSNTQQSDDERLMTKWANAMMREQRASRRWGIFFKSLTFLYLFGLGGYLLWQQNIDTDSFAEPAHVGVVEVKGAIAADSEANADSLIWSLRRAFEAENSKAVILRINSPGGSPVQSGYVYDEIKRLRALHPDKPAYAVITDMGASGAYYIAAAADEIYADKASLVGSIGVISSGFGFVGLMEKLGIERRALSSGDSKALLDPFQPLQAEQKAFWQSVLATTHQQFIDQVKQGRGDRLKDDPRIFSGLIWTGEQAVELGLIDGLSSSSALARDKLELEKLIDYSRKASPIEQLAERFGLGVATAVINQLGLSATSPIQ